jgi:hypothetical protein
MDPIIILTGYMTHQLISASHERSAVDNGISAQNAAVMGNGFVPILMTAIGNQAILTKITADIQGVLAGIVGLMMMLTSIVIITHHVITPIVMTEIIGIEIHDRDLHYAPNPGRDPLHHAMNGPLASVPLLQRARQPACPYLTL